jgi:hypothetical protein
MEKGYSMSTEMDTIIFMGMNKTGADEVRSLRNAGNKVIFIGNSTVQDSINIGKRRYNLSNHTDVVDYVKQLKITPAQEQMLIVAIESAGAHSRDELAQLAKVLAEIDKKGAGPTRFILSSHSAGTVFWGENNGSLEINDFKKIADALPTATGLIEDLHLAGCNSGSENNIRKWRAVFPNVQTIWGYVEEAPKANNGSQTHLQRWDKATRGIKAEIDRAVAAKTLRGDHVAVWSSRFGYQFRKASVIETLLARIRSAEPMYNQYFEGTLMVINPHQGELRDFYNDLQALLGHPLVTEEQKRTYSARKDTTLLLLYFDTKIKSKFMRVHATLIENGYKAIGEKAPDFSRLSRKECVKESIDFSYRVRAKKITTGVAVELSEELAHGLKNLETKHVPLNWI